MNIDKYLDIRYVFILSIINCIFLTCVFKVDTPFDTHTYIDAWATLLDGHVDKWRTPVYPVFIGLMKTIFGGNYMYYIVAVQHMVFLVSIRYFNIILKYITSNGKIIFFLTLFYALYPCVATYNCCIITETFAVVGSIFLLYSIIVLHKTKRKIYSFYVFFWLFFLIFLRPAVVYLLPVTFLFWCLVAIKDKNDKSVVYGISGSVVAGLLLLGYMISFRYSYGVFTPSGIGLINKYTIAKAANIIDFNTNLNKELGFYQEAEYYINKIGMEAFSDSLNQSINRNKSKYIGRLWQNVRKASEDNLFEPSYPNGIIGVFSNIMGPKIKVLYYLFFIYAIFLFRMMMKQKKTPFVSCLLFMIGVSNYIVIILASPGEYGRLSLPAVPVYLIMFGQLLDVIRRKRISEVIFL